MSEEKLKPCLCGGRAEIKHIGVVGIQICCMDCGAVTAVFERKTNAIEAWNKRILKNNPKPTEDGEKPKPPLGVTPYWIELKNRIKELAQAISRQANYVPTPDQRKKSNSLMRGWAQEIQQLLDVIDFLDEWNE